MSWNPKDYCKEGYFGVNNKDIAVCGKENYEKPCIKEKCELYCKKKKLVLKQKGVDNYFRKSKSSP